MSSPQPTATPLPDWLSRVTAAETQRSTTIGDDLGEAEARSGLRARRIGHGGIACQLGLYELHPWSCEVRDEEGGVQRHSGTDTFFFLKACGPTFDAALARLRDK